MVVVPGDGDHLVVQPGGVDHPASLQFPAPLSVNQVECPVGSPFPFPFHNRQDLRPLPVQFGRYQSGQDSYLFLIQEQYPRMALSIQDMIGFLVIEGIIFPRRGTMSACFNQGDLRFEGFKRRMQGTSEEPGKERGEVSGNHPVVGRAKERSIRLRSIASPDPVPEGAGEDIGEFSVRTGVPYPAHVQVPFGKHSFPFGLEQQCPVAGIKQPSPLEGDRRAFRKGNRLLEIDGSVGIPQDIGNRVPEGMFLRKRQIVEQLMPEDSTKLVLPHIQIQSVVDGGDADMALGKRGIAGVDQIVLGSYGYPEFAQSRTVPAQVVQNGLVFLLGNRSKVGCASDGTRIVDNLEMFGGKHPSRRQSGCQEQHQGEGRNESHGDRLAWPSGTDNEAAPRGAASIIQA